MQHFVHKLVVVSFFAHMAIGCCSHHAHGSSDVAVAPSSCTHNHSSSTHDPAEPLHDGPVGHDECEGTQCEFVRIESVSPAGTLAAWDYVAITPSLPNDAVQTAAGLVNPRPTHLAVPLRPDILDQVLLL